MTAPRITAEEISEYRMIAVAPVAVGGMPGLHKILDALESAYAELDRKDKEITYVRGIMQGQETELRAREEQDHIYRVRIELLEADVRRLSAQGGEVPEYAWPPVVDGKSLTGRELYLYCRGWKDLAAKLQERRPAPPHPDTVVVSREEWAELLGIESCVRAVMNYNGLIGTEERNRLLKLDALRAQAQPATETKKESP